MTEQVHVVDLTRHAVLPSPFGREAHKSVNTITVKSTDECPIPANAAFLQYHPDFSQIISTKPKLELLAGHDKDWPWAHEAGIYIKSSNSIFVTSNQIDSDRHEGEKDIILSEVKLSDPVQVIHHAYDQHGLRMANGGINWIGGEGMIFCEQGYNSSRPSALVQLLPNKDGTFTSTTLLNNYHGRAFNSLNDVVVLPSNGTIWFTDPDYGYEQGFKPKPELPSQVYCFDPKTKDIRVVCNNIPKCNGIAFSEDYKTCYITDTEFVTVKDGEGVLTPTKGGWIYAFDVIHYKKDPTRPAYLGNKRIFAFTDCGAPDGIKCDVNGNVFAGCFDGVHVWNAEGTLLGKIVLPDGQGCANLVFGPNQKLYIMAEKNLYVASLAVDGHLLSEL